MFDKNAEKDAVKEKEVAAAAAKKEPVDVCAIANRLEDLLNRVSLPAADAAVVRDDIARLRGKAPAKV